MEPLGTVYSSDFHELWPAIAYPVSGRRPILDEDRRPWSDLKGGWQPLVDGRLQPCRPPPEEDFFSQTE
jgi:hypothetical protein